ncbi:MAG: exopolyphosphatase, partial [Alphaproteobacteria bacterium]
TPKPTHPYYNTLDRDGRVAVAKMAAILRIALSLDAARSSRIRELECHRKGNSLIVSIPGVEDLSVEQLALKQNRGMFEDVFGLQVQFRSQTRS